MKRGDLYQKIKALRFQFITRITHQEQFNLRCPITYEERQPLCLLFIHFGPFENSEKISKFRAWAEKNAKEMDGEANVVIVSGDKQANLANRLGAGSKDSIYVVERHQKGYTRFGKIDHKGKVII
jgi:hypothetical protein